MLTVASVWRTGGPYGAEDVRRLAHCVRKHLPIPHKMLCLSDSPEASPANLGVDQVFALNHRWPGWWSKLEAPRIVGPVLYLDLDTVIVGDIRKLGEAVEALPKGQLMLIRDFYKGLPQTGIMGWSGSAIGIYAEFSLKWAPVAEWIPGRNGMTMRANGRSFAGDGDWIRFFLEQSKAPAPETVQSIMNGGLKSYKVDHLQGHRIPEETRLVAFHGRPRPSELDPKPAWLRESWGVN